MIKIGLVAPFEGLDRPLGYEALAGVRLALAERNSAGGIAGYSVELVALNDFNEPEEARLQAKELAVDPAVVGAVTGWTGEVARASLPVYRQAGLPVAVAWSVPGELAEREAGIVMLAADTQRVAEALAGPIATIRPNQVVVIGHEHNVATYMEALDILGVESRVVAPPEALDSESSTRWASRTILTSLHPADALVLTTDGATAGEVLLTLARLGWSGAVFGGVETGSVHLVSVAGELAAGLTFVSPSPAGNDLFQGTGAWKIGLAELGPRAVLAYDATNVLLDSIQLAIQRDGYPSRPGVIAALPDVQRRGLTGVIAFDLNARRLNAPAWLYRVVRTGYPGQMLSSPEAMGYR